ncbi:hypothetical protein [Lewinella sp. IMCC34183]|uniref:hypothetical protein n=1 Tax=Lewinella sp. IMCC34183 TaxID=2248762 RepID=UPI000E22493B|nr:hypothetical protein [Lewinella sp. IMCC34183]
MKRINCYGTAMRGPHLFRHFFLLLIIAAVVPLSAQYDAGNPCQRPDTDKKNGYYQRNAGRAAKAGDYQDAAVYALYRLATEKRKKQINKATEELEALFPYAIQESDRLQRLLDMGRVVVGESTLVHRAHLGCEYRKFEDIRLAFENLPADRHSPVVDRHLAELIDYSPRIAEAADSLQAAHRQVAELYYRYARSLPVDGSRRSHLQVVLACDRGLFFDRSHPGLAELRTASLPSASGRVYLKGVTSTSGGGKGVASLVRSGYDATIGPGLAETPYFTPVTTDGNLAVHIIVDDVSSERKVDEPDVKERTTEVDDQVLRAKFISHSKSIRATSQGKTVVVDGTTGQEILSTTTSGSHTTTQYWYTYTGNKDALKKRDRKRLSPEPAWESPEKSRQQAVVDLGKNAGYQAVNLFKERGTFEPIQTFAPAIVSAKK